MFLKPFGEKTQLGSSWCIAAKPTVMCDGVAGLMHVVFV